MLTYILEVPTELPLTFYTQSSSRGGFAVSFEETNIFYLKPGRNHTVQVYVRETTSLRYIDRTLTFAPSELLNVGLHENTCPRGSARIGFKYV